MRAVAGARATRGVHRARPRFFSTSYPNYWSASRGRQAVTPAPVGGGETAGSPFATRTLRQAGAGWAAHGNWVVLRGMEDSTASDRRFSRLAQRLPLATCSAQRGARVIEGLKAGQTEARTRRRRARRTSLAPSRRPGQRLEVAGQRLFVVVRRDPLRAEPWPPSARHALLPGLLQRLHPLGLRHRSLVLEERIVNRAEHW